MDDDLGYINMRGRMYDPHIGRFLSPDPFTQFPYDTVGYDRFAYTGNNPLRYVDPSGFVMGLCIDGVCNSSGAAVDMISRALGHYTEADAFRDSNTKYEVGEWDKEPKTVPNMMVLTARGPGWRSSDPPVVSSKKATITKPAPSGRAPTKAPKGETKPPSNRTTGTGVYADGQDMQGQVCQAERREPEPPLTCEWNQEAARKLRREKEDEMRRIFPIPTQREWDRDIDAFSRRANRDVDELKKTGPMGAAIPYECGNDRKCWEEKTERYKNMNDLLQNSAPDKK
jgi:RHS repeat-associated protein